MTAKFDTSSMIKSSQIWHLLLIWVCALLLKGAGMAGKIMLRRFYMIYVRFFYLTILARASRGKGIFCFG